MTYEILRYIFFGGAILSGVMLITAIALFFLLHIPTVIGDLTGINAKRAIESIRNQNSNSGEKTYKSSPVNQERGKLTDEISPSGEIIHESSGGAMPTGKINTQQPYTYAQPVSGAVNYSTMSNETTVMAPAVNSYGETEVLNYQNDSNNIGTSIKSGVIYEIETEITFVHTNEMIE